MTDQAIATPRPASSVERYLDAETRLWQHYGLAPRNRFVDIALPRARLRILEAGSGPPVLFIHGTVGPGSWPSLIASMPGFRSLVLDRPGWGLSTPVEYPRRGYRSYVADLMAGSLDALDIDRVDVVGGSIGDVWALSFAERHPDRVGRIVLLGGGPIVSEVRVPGVIRALASPIGALMVRLPVSEDRLRSMLRESGHSTSLEDGRVADEFFAWRLASANDTKSMRHERDMVRGIVRGSGWRPGFMFDEDQLARIDQPTMLVYGTADPTGSIDIWRRVTGALPHGELHLMEGAGHHPWFDDASLVATRVSRFLADPAGGSGAATAA
jgi:pimeloyl-ACP methyl ester carboxylesterase